MIRETCRAPRPPKTKRKRKRPKVSERTVRPRLDVSQLAELRRELEITAAELARQIGISHSYMRDLESGLRAGSVRVFVRWILALEHLSETGDQ